MATISAADGIGGLRSILCPILNIPCRLLVSVQQALNIVGPQGSNLLELRRESGAKITLLEKRLPVAFLHRGERLVVLRGSLDAIQRALKGIIRSVFLNGNPSLEELEEYQRTVEVMIPEASCPHVIGEQGNCISAIMKATNCDLHIVREPISGLSEQKRLRITSSTLGSLEEGVGKVQEVMLDLCRFGVLSEAHFALREGATAEIDRAPRDRTSGGSGLTIKLLVTKSQVAFIIGKGGCKIGRLRDIAKIAVNDADIPPFTFEDSTLELSGARSPELLHALELILRDLESRPTSEESLNSLRLLLPIEHFESVAGSPSVQGDQNDCPGEGRLRPQPPIQLGGGRYPLRVLEVSGSSVEQISSIKKVYSALEEAMINSGDLKPVPT